MNSIKQCDPVLHSRRTVLRAAGAAVLAVSGGGVRAAEPPINFWVPWPAGGPGDVLARQMLPLLRSGLNRTILVDNLAGVSGALAVQKMLAGPNDGNSFLIGTPSEIILAPLALSAVRYQPEQLRMVGMASTASVVLVGGSHLPARTFAELISTGQAPGAKQYSYGSSGMGTISHLVAEDFAQRTGLKLLHVPYKGTAPVLQDLIGRQLDLAFVAYGGSIPGFIQDGRLRAYAVTQSQRHPALAAVPTVTEIAGGGPFDYEIWGAIFMPDGVPPAALAAVNDAVNRTLADTGFRRWVESTGGTIGRAMSLRDADQFMKEETSKYQRVAKALKLARE